MNIKEAGRNKNRPERKKNPTSFADFVTRVKEYGLIPKNGVISLGNRETAIHDLLVCLKEEYSNEIPIQSIEEIHLIKNRKKYKASKSWFLALTTTLELAIAKDKFSDPDALDKITDFTKNYTSEEFKIQETAREEDIEKANQTLNLALKFLKK